MASELTIQDGDASGDARVLRVAGRLDARNAQMLVQKCQEHLDNGARHVVLNLGDVSFVASSGVGSLLALTEKFQENGGSLHLVHMSDAVSSVVDLLNLGQFLEIATTEEEAVAAIGV